MQPRLDNFYNQPTPVQKLELLPDLFVDVKRDDLIDQDVSGNKWRKLKYNILKAQSNSCDSILTFGGAFSNHIAATAKACQLFGIKSIAIIRGTYVDLNNPTLLFAKNCGMELIPVPIDEYNERNNYNYHDQLKLEFPFAHIVNEGGANYEGVMGTTEILKEVADIYDYVVCAVGTGTTAAGLVLSKPEKTKILAVHVFKSAQHVDEMILNKINLVINDTKVVEEYRNDFMVIDGFPKIGYAKVNEDLKNELRKFYQSSGLPLDLVYTGKMILALQQAFQTGLLANSAKVLVYHSGGLQGNQGFNFYL